MKKKIVLDLETTGLDAEIDEILQLSIIDADKKVTLVDSLIRPLRRKRWNEAQRVHGIAPEDVRNKPTMKDFEKQLTDIFNHTTTIIGYNIDFDLGFLEELGYSFSDKKIVDVMGLFAPIYGEWNDYFEDYKWQKLSTAARYYNYDWGATTAHNSLGDCYATLYVYNQMYPNEIENDD